MMRNVIFDVENIIGAEQAMDYNRSIWHIIFKLKVINLRKKKSC